MSVGLFGDISDCMLALFDGVVAESCTLFNELFIFQGNDGKGEGPASSAVLPGLNKVEIIFVPLQCIFKIMSIASHQLHIFNKFAV